LIAITALMISGCNDGRYHAGRIRAAIDPSDPPVAWPISEDPALEHMDTDALDRLSRDLAASGTHSFLVARYGRIVYEWNSWDAGADGIHSLAAMAKPIVGVTALLVAVTDRRLDLDTPVSRFVDGWAADPVRSKVRVRELITHTSGLDDVDFLAAKRNELTGWAQHYYDNEVERFHMALSDVPFRFAPGSEYRYSGVGYYVFAYVLGSARRGAPQPEVESLLRERIFVPLGIRDDTWVLSYGRTYDVDGMKLRAVGSGAVFPARAVARIATLIAQKGQWNGQQLIDAAAIQNLLGPENRSPASIDHGWWLNWWGYAPSLPPDAMIGYGSGDQVVLCVPSLGLVMVRLGDGLEGPAQSSGTIEDQRAHLEDRLFRPLMQAVLSRRG
jgi:CubicO group peptidase (beta-lactamase class C family)